MKRKSKVVATVICLSLFAVMAMGSGSSSGEKKEVVSSGGAGYSFD